MRKRDATGSRWVDLYISYLHPPALSSIFLWFHSAPDPLASLLSLSFQKLNPPLHYSYCVYLFFLFFRNWRYITAIHKIPPRGWIPVLSKWGTWYLFTLRRRISCWFYFIFFRNPVTARNSKVATAAPLRAIMQSGFLFLPLSASPSFLWLFVFPFRRRHYPDNRRSNEEGFLDGETKETHTAESPTETKGALVWNPTHTHIVLQKEREIVWSWAILCSVCARLHVE